MDWLQQQTEGATSQQPTQPTEEAPPLDNNQPTTADKQQQG